MFLQTIMISAPTEEDLTDKINITLKTLHETTNPTIKDILFSSNWERYVVLIAYYV